jgi:deoxyadenosine/deoxycytidine kinase
MEREGTLPNSFYEAHIALFKNWTMNIEAQFLNKRFTNKLNVISKRSYTMMKSVLFQGCRYGSTYTYC